MKKELIMTLLIVSFVCTSILLAQKHKKNSHVLEANNRNADYPINKILLDRWSPRALSDEPVSTAELMSLFEAARWAPSSYNDQPWRYIYGLKNTNSWQKIFDLLVPFNQEWAKNAAALILVIADTVSAKTGKPSPTYAYDTGAASENLALQASTMGLVAHQMSGFNYEKAREVFNIPESYAILAVIAIGKPGSATILPNYMQKTETPSDRKPINAFVFDGEFKQQA